MNDKEFIEDFIREVRSTSVSHTSPSLLDLVAYEELPLQNTTERGDRNATFRMSVLSVLYRSFSLDDRTFIRYMLEQEIIYHHLTWGFSQSIKLCAFLLFILRQVEDVQLLWQAKTASVNTMHGIDDQLLLGVGIPATIAYLQQVHVHWSEQAKIYIEGGYLFTNEDLIMYKIRTDLFFQKILPKW